MKKKLLPVLLMLIMVLSQMPGIALAADTVDAGAAVQTEETTDAASTSEAKTAQTGAAESAAPAETSVPTGEASATDTAADTKAADAQGSEASADNTASSDAVTSDVKADNSKADNNKDKKQSADGADKEDKSTGSEDSSAPETVDEAAVAEQAVATVIDGLAAATALNAESSTAGTVSSLTLTVTAPTVGQKTREVDPQVTLSGEHVKVRGASWLYGPYTHATDTPDYTFETGRTYYVMVTIEADSGWYFEKGSTFYSGNDEGWRSFDGATISGATLNRACSKTYDGTDLLRIYYSVIPKESGSVISIPTVTVNVEPPSAGDSASDAASTVSIPSGVHYSLTTPPVACYDKVPKYGDWGEPLTEEFSGTFKAGETYYMVIGLIADSGYTFQQGGGSYVNTKVTVNGATLVSGEDLWITNWWDGTEAKSYGNLTVSFTVPVVTHTVTFYADPSHTAVLYSVEVEDGAKLTNPVPEGETPQHPDYPRWKFNDWRLELDGGREQIISDFSSSNVPAVTEDTELYATWYASDWAMTYNLSTGEMAKSTGGVFVDDSSPYGYVSSGPSSLFMGKTYEWERTLTAKPADGYDFYGWVVKTNREEPVAGDTPVSTELTYRYIPVDGTTTSRDERHLIWGVFVKSHEHTLKKVEAVNPTCTEAGTEAYWTCSECGKMFSDEAGKKEISEPVTIAALDHDWGEGVVTTGATCEEPGVRTYTCSRCGETKTEEIVALGHDWGEWTQTKAPTCTETGSEQRVCSHDASHVETREVAALGHNWGEPEYVWSDDYSKVTATVTCTRDSSHIVTETVDTTSEVTKAATCSAKGTKTYTATFTNELFTTQTRDVDIAIDSDAHDWDDGVITTAPTCVAEGVRTYTCKNDSSHTKTETIAIDEDAHDWGEWKVTAEPKWDAAGTEERVCSLCGKKETREIPALKHILTAGGGETHVIGAGKDLEFTFKTNDAEKDKETYSQFTGIKVDGADVDSSGYTAKEGSVIVTLKSDYLDTLSVGDHVLTAVFNEGNNVDATFKISSVEVADTTDEDSSDSSSSSSSSSKGVKTGDESHIVLWSMILAAALIGILYLTVYRKRTER